MRRSNHQALLWCRSDNRHILQRWTQQQQQQQQTNNGWAINEAIFYRFLVRAHIASKLSGMLLTVDPVHLLEVGATGMS